MKSVTEFFSHKLIKGNTAKAALLAEGKTPEEIELSIGETFKLEGEKLKFFVNSMAVAEENAEKLGRILVFKVEEGESVPPKAVLVEEHCYIPEFQKAGLAAVTKKAEKGKGAGQKKGKKNDGPKPSPWGISPEEKAAKLDAAKKADRDKSK